MNKGSHGCEIEIKRSDLQTKKDEFEIQEGEIEIKMMQIKPESELRISMMEKRFANVKLNQ